jgi:hypothetical protein
MIVYKYPTIALGATPIGSANHSPDEELLREDNARRTMKKIFESIIGSKHHTHGLDIFSHQEHQLCIDKIIWDPKILGSQ